MAFIQSTPDDEEQKEGQAPVIPGAGGGGAGVGGRVAGAGEVTLAEPGGQQAPTTEVVDTASYLAANRPQAESLAGFVGGKLQEEQTGLQKDIGEKIGGFKSEVESARIPFDEELIQRAALDPSKFVQEEGPEGVEQFTRQRTAEYKGPGALDEQDYFPGLENRLRGVERRPGQVETERGREALLFEIGESPTQGQVTLDQLLLGANPAARRKLSESVQPVPGLRREFETRSGEAREARKGAVGEAEKARQAVQERFYGEGGVVPSFQQGLEQRLGETRAQQTARAEAALQDLMDKGQLDPKSAQYLGISSPESHQKFLRNIEALQQDYGSPLSIDQYLQRTTAEGKIPNLEAVASLEDVARQKALQQLLGQDFQAPLREDQIPTGMRDYNLASFNEAEANRQAMLGLSEADRAALMTGTYGVWGLPMYPGGEQPQQNLYFADDPAVHALYNAMQRRWDPTANRFVMESPGGDINRTDIQAKFMDLYGKQFGVPTQPGDAFTPPPTDTSAWQPGQSRLRVVEGGIGGDSEWAPGVPRGEMAWWDGGQWVQAPPEFIYEDAAGNQVGPGDRRRTKQFNFETGEYEVIEELPEVAPPTQPGQRGPLPPGVFTGWV